MLLTWEISEILAPQVTIGKQFVRDDNKLAWRCKFCYQISKVDEVWVRKYAGER